MIILCFHFTRTAKYNKSHWLELSITCSIVWRLIGFVFSQRKAAEFFISTIKQRDYANFDLPQIGFVFSNLFVTPR
jgi:hypothetical protein